MVYPNAVDALCCPFCGRVPPYVVYTPDNRYFLMCMDTLCGASGPIGNNEQDAIEKWNTRPWVKHLEHMIESHMNVIDKLNARIKGLEDIVDELNKEISARGVAYECEHAWRQSPYDAGLTFCCLCGIEHED